MRKYMKATEVEAMMDETRKANDFVGDTERKIVNGYVKAAKRNGCVGDKILMVVNPYEIHMPKWQRKADISRAKEIGDKYNRNKWELPKVFMMDGKLYASDGQHRILGAFLAGKDEIVVEYMEIDELDAIELFLAQTKGRKRMSPDEVYGAAIDANKPDYVKVRNICHKYRVQVKGDDSVVNPIGEFTSLNDGVKMDAIMLNRIIKTITQLNWYGSEKTPYNSKVIRSLKKIYSANTGRENEINDILMKKCKGTDWYVKNLARESQYKIFDLLTDTLISEDATLIKTRTA